MKQKSTDCGGPGAPHSTLLEDLGHRVTAVMDRLGSRTKASEVAGRSADQLWKYSKGNVEPPFLPLAKMCLAAGIRMEWLATGEGAMLLEDSARQPLRRDVLKLTLQLVEEALDGRTLNPADYAELVDLVYDTFVLFASRGIEFKGVQADAHPAADQVRKMLSSLKGPSHT